MIKLLGIQTLDFTTNDGKHIAGKKLHYSYEPTGNASINSQGVFVETKFIDEFSHFDMPVLRVGQTYDFITSFNGRKAEIVGIKEVQPNK